MEFSTHTTNGPLPVCHLLDDGPDISTKHGKYIVRNLYHPHKSSQSERLLCLLSFFSFSFSRSPRAAARSSKSARGVVKLGQLLHRLVSKPCYVSHTWVQFCILTEVPAPSARSFTDKQVALIALHHPQWWSNKNHLSEPTPLSCTAVAILVPNVLHVREFSVLLPTFGIRILLFTNVRQGFPQQGYLLFTPGGPRFT